MDRRNKSRFVFIALIAIIIISLFFIYKIIKPEDTSITNESTSDETEKYIDFCLKKLVNFQEELCSDNNITGEKCEGIMKEFCRRNKEITTREFWEMPFEERLKWTESAVVVIRKVFPEFSPMIAKTNILKALVIAGEGFETKEAKNFRIYVKSFYPDLLFASADLKTERIVEIKCKEQSFWNNPYQIKIEIDAIINDIKTSSQEAYDKDFDREVFEDYKIQLYRKLLINGSENQEEYGYKAILNEYKNLTKKESR